MKSLIASLGIVFGTLLLAGNVDALPQNTQAAQPPAATNAYPDESTRGLAADFNNKASTDTATDAASTDTTPADAASTDAASTDAAAADATTADAAKTDAAATDAAAKDAAETATEKGKVDISSDAPVSKGPALGADARDAAHYFPPKNPVVEKRTLSWAKIESFHQLAEAQGIPDNTAAAIAGNLQHESGAFQLNQWEYDPATGQNKLLTTFGASSQGDKQNGVFTSFGIAQYHNERGTDMMNTVGGKSLTPDGLQGTTNAQYQYLFKDIKGQMNSTNYNELMNPNTSVDRATEIFVSKYERPASADSRYGLAGGTDRFNNASALQNVWNSQYQTSSDFNSTYVAPRNTNTSSNPNNYNNNNNNNYTNNSNNNANNPLANLLGLNSNNSNSFNGTNTNSLFSQLLSGMMGNNTASQPTTGATTGTGTVGSDSSSPRSEKAELKDTIRKIADACDVKTPNMKKKTRAELEEKLSLMIKRCSKSS